MGMEVGMMEIDSVDMNQLAAEASNIVSYPGALSSISIREFLSRFPFPILFSALSRESGDSEFVALLCEALEKIVLSPNSKSVLPEVLPYMKLGLTAGSPVIRRLACDATGKFLEPGDFTSAQAAAGFDIVEPLLNTLSDDDSSVAKAAADALVNLARTPDGLKLLFDGNRLTNFAMNGSALVRIRALSLAARVFGLSHYAAAAVQNSGVLQVLERELANTEDILAQINAVEILCELAETPAGSNLLLTGNFVTQLVHLIGNFQVDIVIRCRCMIVGSRLISSVSQADAFQIIRAIVSCLRRIDELDNNSERWDKTEKEAAIEALGQIGSTSYGAEAILSGSEAPAKHVVHLVFKGHGDTLRVAALHALALILGSEREEVLLRDDSENVLRSLVFDEIQHNPLSNKLLQLLRETHEVRQAVYMLVIPLVTRPWCLWEVSSNSTLIDFVVDPQTESSKSAMEWRHACCEALSTALASATKRGEHVDPETLEKLNIAVQRGPYLPKEHVDAVPAVATEERF